MRTDLRAEAGQPDDKDVGSGHALHSYEGISNWSISNYGESVTLVP